MNRYEVLDGESKVLDALGTKSVAIRTAKDDPAATTVLDLETGSVVWSRDGMITNRVRSL